MSKRFGKNQKRKLNSEIEALKKQVEYWKKAKADTDRQGRDDRETICYVAKIFGQHFAGLEPVMEMVQRIPRTHRIAEVSVSDFGSYRDVKFCVDRSLRIIELRPMEVKKTVDQLRKEVHIFLQTPSGEVAYAMSNEAWEDLRRDRRTLEYVARSMMSLINK